MHIFAALAMALTMTSTYAQQVRKITPRGTRYLLYTPPNYSPDTASPLLVVLHGQGSLGSDLGMLERRDGLPSKLIAERRWPKELPFVVATPQLERDASISNPRDQDWPPEMVDELISQIQQVYTIDSTRMYMTGISKGARGGYDYAASFPNTITAMVLISGALDSTRACQVKDIPLWIFHGTEDVVVPPSYAHAAIRSSARCSPKGKHSPRLTLLQGRGHSGWDEIYDGTSGYDIYGWLLQYRNAKDPEPEEPPVEPPPLDTPPVEEPTPDDPPIEEPVQEPPKHQTAPPLPIEAPPMRPPRSVKLPKPENPIVLSAAWRPEIEVYPNPASGEIMIFISPFFGSPVYYCIKTTVGAEIDRGYIASSQHRIDLRSLNKGIYILYLMIDGKAPVLKRFAVQ